LLLTLSNLAVTAILAQMFPILSDIGNRKKVSKLLPIPLEA